MCISRTFCLKPLVSFKATSVRKGHVGKWLRALALQPNEPAMSLAHDSLAVWSGARPLSLARGLMGESLALVLALQAVLHSNCPSVSA